MKYKTEEILQISAAENSSSTMVLTKPPLYSKKVVTKYQDNT